MKSKNENEKEIKRNGGNHTRMLVGALKCKCTKLNDMEKRKKIKISSTREKSYESRKKCREHRVKQQQHQM